MKILILSCNTGEGHNAAGHAVLEAARLRGHDAVLQDMMLLSSERTSRLVGNGYVYIARTLPHIFGIAYKLAGFISNRYVNPPSTGQIQDWQENWRHLLTPTTMIS